MTASTRRWVTGLILLFITLTRGEEGSLQSALNAINRKQRDLSEYPRYGEFYSEGGLSRYSYPPEENEELAFSSPGSEYNHDKEKNDDLEHALLDYLEEEDLSDSDGDNLNRRISSSFRERVEEDKVRQREKLAELLLNKLQNTQNADLEEYSELMELLDKYRNDYSDISEDFPVGYQTNHLRRRSNPRDFYSNIGFDTVGMKKRSRYFEPDGPGEALYLLNYAPRDEIFNRLQEDIDNPEFEHALSSFQKDRVLEPKDRQQFSHSSSKRFPVSKRSSNYYPVPYSNEFTRQHKRSPNKETLVKTDPKVANDLSNIFNPKSKEVDGKPKKKETSKLRKSGQAEEMERTLGTSQKDEGKDPVQIDNTKEIVPPIHKEKPLQLKKKSIDWSDYFGLDRRKKSNDIDNEWLMERYHKAVAMAAKRDSDSSHVRNHNQDKSQRSESSEKEKKNDQSIDELKISEMDTKLKNIEDSIVDRTLKYTGAHEGAVDSKEIQEVKDRVIAQLAAAYSLEKMRRALGEYKQSIEREKNRLKQANKDDHFFSEEKRLSVPRKAAIDEDREKIGDGDNNIKCTQGDEDCNEQNYRVPSEIIEQANWDREDCPKVQRACNEVASTLGHYGRSFESACAIHQKCLLCGDNSWFAPTRQCNVLFLTKADEICDNDPECQRVARHSIRYLIDVSRTLKAEPVETCDLVCPDKRR